MCRGKGEAVWQATWQLGGWGLGWCSGGQVKTWQAEKKPPQRFRTKTQADKKTRAGIQSNSQFCCSPHKHATSPWHTRFSSLLAPLAKNFLSSFRGEEGSKLTLSAEHGVSTSSVYSHKKHISDSGTIISYSDIYCIYWDLSYAFFKIWYWKLIRRSS